MSLSAGKLEALFEALYKWLKKGYEDHKKKKAKQGQCSKCGGTGQVPKGQGKKGKGKK